MRGTLTALAAAALLAAGASLAAAAPAATLGGMAGNGAGNAAQEADGGVLKVHGFHEHCARDRYGWHRHNQWGERRRCREWRGRGPRPDFCVRVGPLWVCDY